MKKNTDKNFIVSLKFDFFESRSVMLLAYEVQPVSVSKSLQKYPVTELKINSETGVIKHWINISLI